MTKKEKQEHIEYIKSIIKKNIKFDERKEELVLGFIFNILTSNRVMNRYECSRYGNIMENDTIGIAECINYIALKLNLKDNMEV